MITDATAKATYDYLLCFEPFSRWKMPKDLTFRVVAHVSEFGRFDPNRKEILVSSANVSKLPTLIRVMAHEMIHAHEHALSRWSHKHDNATFLRCKAQVCKAFDFDPGEF